MQNLTYLLIDNAKFIAVKFDNSGREYYYKTVDNVSAGDSVVVFAQGEYKVVEVTRVVRNPDLKEGVFYKWIVQKVDTQKQEFLESSEREMRIKIEEKEEQEARALAKSQLGVDESELNAINSKLKAL